jgi:hypothetical protein
LAEYNLSISRPQGLHKLHKAEGGRFQARVALCGRRICVGFGDRLFAVPIRLL